jgi:putative copper export protein
MLAVNADTIRLFLHVLAATVWVGGQLTLAALVPALRGAEGATQAAARRFNLVAWPAFGVLVATGIWNIFAVPHQSAAFKATLQLKLTLVALSGVAALVHTRVQSRLNIAIWGALSGLTALGALFVGVMLAQ